MAAGQSHTFQVFAGKTGDTPEAVEPYSLGVTLGPLIAAAVVGGAVLAASLLGILSRPIGQLASFWPTNALLLGLMLRDRQFTQPLCWVAALIGYLAADLITGSTLQRSALLTMGNFAGVIGGIVAWRFVAEENRSLGTPLAVLYLLLVAIVASASAGLVGMFISALIFNRPPLTAWVYWFISELVNFIAILPVMLTLPKLPWRLGRMLFERRRAGGPPLRLHKLMPFATLMLSVLLAGALGGPGAIAVSVPALLWCALTYPRFITMLITLLCSAWVLVAAALGHMDLGVDTNDYSTQLSMRLGVMLIALAPITAASVMAARNELLDRLRHMADHDSLTRTLNRNAFRKSALDLLDQVSVDNRSAGLLMLDLDHFKLVNDTHGHQAGDMVLIGFSQLVASHLRASDAFGRLGGEEFAVLLPHCRAEDAKAIAERIRSSLAATRIKLADGSEVSITVSIGLAHADAAQCDLEALLQSADRALYRAKNGGRNRVEFVSLSG